MKKISFVLISLLVLFSTFSLGLDPVDVKITGSNSIQANTPFDITISLNSKNQRVQNFDFYVKSQNSNVIFSNGQRTGSDYWFPSRTPFINLAEDNGAVWRFKINPGTDGDTKVSTTDKQVFVLRGVASGSDVIQIDTARSVVNRLFSPRDTDQTPTFQLSTTDLTVTVATAPTCTPVAATVCVAGNTCAGNTLVYVAPLGCPSGQQCDANNNCVASPPAAVCQPPISRCNNGVREGCSLDGSAWESHPCPAGQECVGAGVCQAVPAGQSKSQQLGQQIQQAVAERQADIDNSPQGPPVGFLTKLMAIIRGLWQ